MLGVTFQDGCAAVGVWAVGEKIVVANVGDAKCVLARVSIKVCIPIRPSEDPVWGSLFGLYTHLICAITFDIYT